MWAEKGGKGKGRVPPTIDVAFVLLKHEVITGRRKKRPVIQGQGSGGGQSRSRGRKWGGEGTGW